MGITERDRKGEENEKRGSWRMRWITREGERK